MCLSTIKLVRTPLLLFQGLIRRDVGDGKVLCKTDIESEGGNQKLGNTMENIPTVAYRRARKNTYCLPSAKSLT